MSHFSEFNLQERLVKALDKLGFSEFTDVQKETIPRAAEGRDLVVSAKTGSGKTGAFLIPMLERFLAEDRPKAGTRALVLVPTRELALQIEKAFKAFAAFTQTRCGVIMVERLLSIKSRLFVVIQSLLLRHQVGS